MRRRNQVQQDDFNSFLIAIGLVLGGAVLAVAWLGLEWWMVALPLSILLIGIVYSAWERWR